MKDIGELVYTANDTFEAAGIISILESAGIPAYTKELGAGQVFRIYTGYSNTGTEIYVPTEAAEEAKTLISAAAEDTDEGSGKET